MNTKPNILMISGDPAILDEGSAVFQRLSEYARWCERLEVLVCTRTAVGERHTSTLYARGVICTNVLGVYRAIILGEHIPKPELVTTQDPFFLGIIGLFIARHHRIPLEVQIHTDLFDPEFSRFSLGNRLRVLLARFVISHAEHVRVVSERIKKTLNTQKLKEGVNISVIPVPVSITLPAHGTQKMSRNHNGLHVLSVSRLTPEKNIPLAIDAFALLYRQNPQARFTIVGSGPLQHSLEVYAERCGVSSAVTFVGNQKDVAPYYREADVYLSTSYYEGYGLALIEAALYAVPIVSTNVGIVEELGPVTLVPRDAQKISEALQSTKSSPHVPSSLFLTVSEGVQRVTNDWVSCIAAPHIPRMHTRAYFFAKYVISGLTATAVNLSFLYILTEFFSIWYVISAGLSYASAFMVSFILQKFWTFRNGTLTNIHSQFGLYIMLGIFNIILNSYLIYVIVEFVGVHYIIAQVGIGLFIALWSLLFYRFLFRPKMI